MNAEDTLLLYQNLAPGEQVQVAHDVKIGFRQWTTVTSGTVVSKSRERHSLHFRRNPDDRVFRDVLVLRREDGELTTVTLDEFTTLTRVDRSG